MSNDNTQSQPLPKEETKSEDNENKDDEKSVYKSPPGIDNPNDDFVISESPTDTITSIYFSPQNNCNNFAVTTWDKEVRYYKTISEDSKILSSVNLVNTQYHNKPVLDSCFNGNNANKLYSVGCDRIIKVWDLEKNIFSTMDFKPTQQLQSQSENINIDTNDEKKTLSNDNENKNQNINKDINNINEDIKNLILNKIKEWHPKICNKLMNKLLLECNETQCKSYLNDLISFRVKIDNLALKIIENDIKNATQISKEEPVIENKSESKNIIKYLHHALPIGCIKYISENNVIITGSWDKKIKYWDTRASICCGSIDLGHKIYCMASLTPILTVGLSNKHVQVYDLRNPSQEIISKTTPLKHQLRCMDIFPSKDGFGVGSIEGRVAIEMIDSKESKKKNFSFKCHRHSADKDINNDDDDNKNNNNNNDIVSNQTNVYGVNSISFHPNGTFITGGSDGEINYWDRIQRSRLKHTKRMKLPIVATSFNYNASLLIYGTSYDWSQGAQGFNKKNHKPQIYITNLDEKNNINSINNNNNNNI